MSEDEELPIIEWLALPSECAGDYTVEPALEPDPWFPPEQKGRWLGPLRKLNVLVGPNNSGKSRLLRMVFGFAATTEPSQLPDLLGYRELAVEAIDLGNRVRVAVDKAYNLDQGIERRAPGLRKRLTETLDMNLASVLVSPTSFETWRKIQNELGRLAGSTGNRPGKSGVRDAQSEVTEYTNELEAIAKRAYARDHVRFVFIPSRRAIGAPSEAAARSPAPATTQGGFVATPRETFDGADLYRRIRAGLLGNLAARTRIERFEEFLSRQFFRGRPVTLIPAEDDEGGSTSLTVKIGKERERPIGELGDGIQQIIILAYPIFEYAADHLVLFVDEPELSLHPGLQRVFANVCLDEKCDPGGTRQVLVCTHSNHLLDLTIDAARTAVFRVSKDLPETEAEEIDPHFTIQAFADDEGAGSLQLLRDLGAQNTSMLMSNCAIWVEGVSDRNYYRAFLRVLMEERGISGLHEDTHYSFVEYGGGNITHWSFLEDGAPNAKRITSRMMVICDRDAGKKEGRHEKLRAALGDENVVVLECREVENLLTPDILARTVERLEDGQMTLRPAFDQQSYRRLKIGKFIDDKLLCETNTTRAGGSPRKKGGYEYGDENGALKEKNRFSTIASELIQEPAHLSDEARRVAEAMLDFVVRHNPDSPRVSEVTASDGAG